jgi:excinuclease ABC subunit B
MQKAMDETQRRRVKQLAYNAEHGITPETVKSAITAGILEEIEARQIVAVAAGQKKEDYVTQEYLEELHHEMLAAAANLEFERAAKLRDKIAELKGEGAASPQGAPKRRGRRKR